MANTDGSRPSLKWTGVCIDCADADELAMYGAEIDRVRDRLAALVRESEQAA